MFNKEKNFISAVIYVYNKENYVAEFVESIRNFLECNFEHSEIICVNDGSSDQSVMRIKEVSQKSFNTSISVINMSSFHGVELAMNAGVDLAIGDFVFEFDNVCLDFDENDVMNVYQKALTGFDIVSASVDGKSKVSSGVFYNILDKFADAKYNLTTERFRILSRRVINRIGSINKVVPYRKAAYANCGLKTTNILYSAKRTVDNIGLTSRENKYRRNLAGNVLILFTNLGYEFSVTMTAIMSMITILIGVYAALTYMFGNPVEGWTTTTLFLAFAFFGLFGVLTIVVKYLQIIVDLIFKRKRYNFESIEKLTK